MNNTFVYCWSDKATSKVYAGMHTGFEDDGYVCSSKSMLKEYAQRPTDFSRQIIAKGLLEDCRELETKINSKLLKDLDTCYNRTAGKRIVNEVPPMLGKKHSAETKKKWVGRTHSKEVLAQIGSKLKGRISPRKGAILSKETKEKIANTLKGKVSPMKGKTFSDEAKMNMRIAALNKPPVSDKTRLKLSDAAKKQWLKMKEV
jgi:hypothetical protein